MTFRYSDKNPAMPAAYSSTEAMHTRMEMVLAGIPGRDAVRAVTDSVWDQVAGDDRLMNRFSPESELHRINMTASLGPQKLSGELFMVLGMCRVFRDGTRGYFDITANMACRGCPEEPGYLLDEKEHTVVFTREDVRLDLGGFAKGYALEKAAKRLREAGVRYALMNMGDSSSCAIGTHPFGDWWPAGIEHPYFSGRTLHEFRLKDSALSVSGKNRSGRPHIIDPMTGNLVDREEMVAVTGPSPLAAEVLSTALYTAPEQARKEILAGFPGYAAYSITPLCNGEGRISSI